MYIIVDVDTGAFDKVSGSHQLSKNFQVHEFVSRDANTLLYSGDLVASAQRIRDKHGKALHLTNAHREIPHNIDVGGSVNSEHLSGHAIDCFMNGVTSKELGADFAQDLGYLSNIGIYFNRIHVGNGGQHRRHTY